MSLRSRFCLLHYKLLSRHNLRLKLPPLRLAERQSFAQVFDTTPNGGIKRTRWRLAAWRTLRLSVAKMSLIIVHVISLACQTFPHENDLKAIISMVLVGDGV